MKLALLFLCSFADEEIEALKEETSPQPPPPISLSCAQLVNAGAKV